MTIRNSVVVSLIVGAACARSLIMFGQPYDAKPGQQTAKTTDSRNKKWPGDASAKAGVMVEVTSLSIYKAPTFRSRALRDFGSIDEFFGYGVSLQLCLADPAREIVGLDENLTKITACTDDKGTDLTIERKSDFRFTPIQFYSRKDRQTGVIVIKQPGTPVAGATRIRLTGQLVLRCASGERTYEQKNVALHRDSSIDVGPVPFRIIDAEVNSFFPERPFKLTLQTELPIDGVKDIELFDASGNKLKEADNIASSDPLGLYHIIGDKKIYQRFLNLAQQVKQATVRIKHYERVESVTIPLDLELGVGF